MTSRSMVSADARARERENALLFASNGDISDTKGKRKKERNNVIARSKTNNGERDLSKDKAIPLSLVLARLCIKGSDPLLTLTIEVVSG